MKIFKMNDCDWMAGEDAESVKKEYAANYSDGDHENQEPRQLTEEELDNKKFFDTEIEPYKHRTFREELQRLIDADASFPRFFASTEF